MRKGWTFAVALVAVLALSGWTARADATPTDAGGTHAEAPEGHGAAEGGEAPAHGGHGTEGCFADHWSLFDTVPALRHNLCGAFGRSYLEGQQVGRGMHVVMALVVLLAAMIFSLLARRALAGGGEKALVPQSRLSFFTFFEILIQMLLAMMSNMMGEKHARRFLPLIAGLAIFILFSNLLGMIPGFLPPTDNLNTTLALGSVVFVMTHVAGVQEHGIAYFKHFLGPIIKWYALPLMLLMLVIETISHLVRPASLAMRLMGNMFGDHMVLGVFLSFHLLLVPLPIQVLGLLVAVVQTLVFCLLSIVYISMAVEHQEH